MKPLHTIKDIAVETRIVRGRVIAACFVILALTGVLLLRMVQLQVMEYEHFSTLSEDNRVKIVPLAPTRGLIYDRNGVELAQNLPTFSLEIVPENVDDMDELLAELGELVKITPEDIERFQGMLKKKRPFQSVPLRYRLNEEEVARFSVNRHRFPGADVHARLTRNYPLGPLQAAARAVERIGIGEPWRISGSAKGWWSGRCWRPQASMAATQALLLSVAALAGFMGGHHDLTQHR